MKFSIRERAETSVESRGSSVTLGLSRFSGNVTGGVVGARISLKPTWSSANPRVKIVVRDFATRIGQGVVSASRRCRGVSRRS